MKWLSIGINLQECVHNLASIRIFESGVVDYCNWHSGTMLCLLHYCESRGYGKIAENGMNDGQVDVWCSLQE